jgi:membrane-bound lytic murein transglycosylase A
MHKHATYCKSALRHSLFALAVLFIAGCATKPIQPESVDEKPTASLPNIVEPTVPNLNSAITAPPNPNWKPVALADLPNWQNDSPLAAWSALQRSCSRLGQRAPWQAFCKAAATTPSSDDAARAMLQTHLTAYTQSDDSGNATGTATAYFEPIYSGSLQRSGAYQWPLYAAPEPMTALPREQLTPTNGKTNAVMAGKELAWLDNPIDPFLAQVQGSLRVRLADGSVKRLGFAGKNGLPYASIANTLIRQGVFTANQASMERIKSWATGKDNATVQAVLNTNPSFVFFRWLDIPADLGPVGAYNVPLTPMRSVAVDTAFTPLGVPLWLDTTTANGAMQQLMLAQDVGSAIKGVARVDLYAGTGDAAGKLASAQKYPSKVWVLWPK